MEIYKGWVVLVVFVTNSISCLAKVYTVGDSSGWSLSVDYKTWTSDKTFKVGDSLVFNYDSSHTVTEVSSDDYDACNVANSINSYSSSPTTVALNTTGTHYFICGVAIHCGGGMKVSVPVTGGGATTAPSGTDGSPSGKPTPTPSTSTGTGKVPASSSVTVSPVLGVLLGLVSLVVMFVLA